MPTAGRAFSWSILFLMAAPYAVVGAARGPLFYQYRRAGRPGSGRVLRILGRAVRLRCRRCGRTPLYRGAFAMHARCAACGLRYEHEQGYFVGAIYINYAATVVVAAGTVLAADALLGLTLAQQLALGIALAALVPLPARVSNDSRSKVAVIPGQRGETAAASRRWLPMSPRPTARKPAEQAHVTAL